MQRTQQSLILQHDNAEDAGGKEPSWTLPRMMAACSRNPILLHAKQDTRRRQRYSAVGRVMGSGVGAGHDRAGQFDRQRVHSRHRGRYRHRPDRRPAGHLAIHIILAALLLPFGKLGDARGRKLVFRIGTVIFVAGSVLAAASWCRHAAGCPRDARRWRCHDYAEYAFHGVRHVPRVLPCRRVALPWFRSSNATPSRETRLTLLVISTGV